MEVHDTMVAQQHGGFYPPGGILLSPDGQLSPHTSRADLERKVDRLCRMLAEALEARCPGCGNTRIEAVRR